MKIIVFGATGNMGRRVLAQGVNKGHEMTAFVRNSEKLYEQQGEQIAGQLKVIAKDIMDPEIVSDALSQQDAVIIAAGNAFQGEEFVSIVDNIVSQCENNTQFSGRVWLMGGAGLLDIPYTDLIGNHLPGFPPMYHTHNRNLERLQLTKLDWSVMCPGTMVESADLPSSVRLHVSTDILPVPVPEAIRDFSEAEVAGYLFSRFKELDVAYEDAADCILNHLELDGPFKGKRIGLAYLSEQPVN
jgi:putative NADH-flavin reductase